MGAARVVWKVVVWEGGVRLAAKLAREAEEATQGARRGVMAAVEAMGVSMEAAAKAGRREVVEAVGVGGGLAVMEVSSAT